tara:strand:+ start:9671 stop:9832 length:162 start_codon:yes stop_codon:yes gene_type:complete
MKRYRKKWSRFLDAGRKEKTSLFKQFDGTGSTSSEINQVLPASLEGEIDALSI